MRNFLSPAIRLLGLAFVVILIVSSQVLAEIATADEARLVSRNWLSYITYQTGTWAGSTQPEIINMQEITIKDVVHGYHFSVKPRGFILVPALKELAPIKAYSDENDLDPEASGGMALMLRDVLEQRIQLYVDQYGSMDAEQPKTGDVLFGREQRQAWDNYLVSVDVFSHNLTQGKLGAVKDIGPLLTTKWHQGDPYNQLCPIGDGGRVVVGCVATAAAQLITYYQWPICGTGEHTYWWAGDTYCGGSTPGAWLSAEYNDLYDWANIVDDCDYGCTAFEQDALSELNYEMAVAFNMDFSYCGSGTYTYIAQSVLPTYFRFKNQISRLNRDEHTQNGWSIAIQGQLTNNRPILYSIYSHCIVCDGWRDAGPPDQVHMNYGWGGSQNAWYTIDNLHCPWPGCDPDVEYMMTDIEPNKLAYFTSDTVWGNVPLSVNFFGNSSESIGSWEWSFGDGGDAYIQDPNHLYTTPGRHDVTLYATTSGKAIYPYTATKYITALADSMIGENITGEPNTQVEVNIYAANTIPISGLRIPVDYSGNLNLTLDSWTTTGCRTDYFDYANNVAAGSKKSVYLIYNTNPSTPDLEPGSGPVIKLTFSIPSGATPDQGAQVSVEEFWSYVPQFFTDIIPDYTPQLVPGSVALPFDCGDVNGDLAVNIFDVTDIISYLYLQGDPLDPMKSADVNNDCTVNIFDVTSLICYLYLDCTELNCPGMWPCK